MDGIARSQHSLSMDLAATGDPVMYGPGLYNSIGESEQPAKISDESLNVRLAR